jgi:hypothetical protein
VIAGRDIPRILSSLVLSANILYMLVAVWVTFEPLLVWKPNFQFIPFAFFFILLLGNGIVLLHVWRGKANFRLSILYCLFALNLLFFSFGVYVIATRENMQSEWDVDMLVKDLVSFGVATSVFEISRNIFVYLFLAAVQIYLFFFFSSRKTN